MRKTLARQTRILLSGQFYAANSLTDLPGSDRKAVEASLGQHLLTCRCVLADQDFLAVSHNQHGQEKKVRFFQFQNGSPVKS